MDYLKVFNPLDTGRFHSLTGSWRGFRNEAGKMIGSHQMSKSARDAYDEAREKYRKNGEQKDLDEMKKIAEEQHKIRKDRNEAKAAAKQAAKAVQSPGLIALTGSEKQIAWAEKIRNKALTASDRFEAIVNDRLQTESNRKTPSTKLIAKLEESKTKIEKLRQELRNMPNSSFFIDHYKSAIPLDLPYLSGFLEPLDVVNRYKK